MQVTAVRKRGAGESPEAEVNLRIGLGFDHSSGHAKKEFLRNGYELEVSR